MGRRIFVNVRFQIRPVRGGTDIAHIKKKFRPVRGGTDRAHILPDFAATAETGRIVHTSGRDPEPCCARSGHRHGEEAGAAPNHIPIQPPFL